MELPPYRLPTLRSVAIKMMGTSGTYLRKAGTTILGISILLWAATTFPKPASYRVDAQIAAGQVTVVSELAGGPTPTAAATAAAAAAAAAATVPAVVTPAAAAPAPVALASASSASTSFPHATATTPGDSAAPRLTPVPLTPSELAARRASEDLSYSVAGHIGRALEPVFKPLGFDWKIVTAMIGAFAAKEVFVAQMGIVYSIADAHQGTDGLRAVLARDYSRLAGFCMMLFLLVATPCMATTAVTRRESGRWRWALLQQGGLTTIAYLLTLAVYQLGRLVT
jgi:ferrous iron transport protein B